MRKPPIYTEDEIQALAAYIATFGPGPAIPSAAQIDGWKTADIARGGELFRVNCAQCHQAAGSGGALTNGKYAPSLMRATPLEIYEAMLTGPQSMPVFGDASLPMEEKQQIIAYIEEMKRNNNPGGLSLGRLGPVTEGLFIWTIGLGAVIAAAVWIGAKVR
jgi:ubiquinol-cytochrome c reductase cytochrome c subunit